jgi:tetratricopeptide (TPR) repeat protein
MKAMCFMKALKLTPILLLIVVLQAFSQGRTPRSFEPYERAESEYNSGNYENALSLVDEFLKENPGYFDAYSLRGSIKEMLKDLNGALTDYSIYLEHFPENRDILLNRAVINYRIGFFAASRDDFNKLLLLPSSGETNSIFYRKNMSMDDKNPMMTMTGQNSHRSYLFNYLGLTEAKLKNLEQAKIHFDSAIRLDTTEPDYLVNRGLIKEALKDSTAFSDYEAALRINPNHTLAKHNLTAFHAKKDQTLSPEDRLTETLEADPTMLNAYLERAQQRYESKYYAGAEEDYTNAIEIDPMDVEIWLGRGLAREKQKNYKGAFSDYTHAIELKENFAKAWLNRGNVLLKMERYEDAVEDYSVALIYYPDFSAAYFNRGIANMKLKKDDEACKDVNRAKELGMEIDEKLKSKVCNN